MTASRFSGRIALSSYVDAGAHIPLLGPWNGEESLEVLSSRGLAASLSSNLEAALEHTSVEPRNLPSHLQGKSVLTSEPTSVSRSNSDGSWRIYEAAGKPWNSVTVARTLAERLGRSEQSQEKREIVSTQRISGRKATRETEDGSHEQGGKRNAPSNRFNHQASCNAERQPRNAWFILDGHEDSAVLSSGSAESWTEDPERVRPHQDRPL
ncbi:hypothetical protein TREES_T100010058 [Tupaia chinensis]|uniref:Uncharacterized protein n=1 Tax=Tupaia chinensis TaxID=246437 RepID=L9KF90_TUPCH|nr:hypothetical protein TREES_T100010058 [Tupaia chinensis]